MQGVIDQLRFSFTAEVKQRAESWSWGRMALRQPEQMTCTNDLIAAAKDWLDGSGNSPDFVATARVEIEDTHWAILNGIARGSLIGVPPGSVSTPD